jgi:hypothetical protein
MANYKAVASGNWSALATWQDDAGGSYVASTVLPGASDVVYFNNFTVQINVDVTVSQIRNDSSTGVTAGGSGVVSASRTVNANITSGSATATIIISAGAGNTVNINGDVAQIFALANLITISITGTAVVNIVGNITTNQSGVNSSSAISTTVASTINVTGNINTGVQSGNTSGAAGLSCGSNATINVAGNVYAGTNGRANIGIRISGSGTTVNITGNVYGGTTTDLAIQNAGIAISGAISNVAVNTTGIIEAGSNTPALLGTTTTTGQFRHTGIVKDGVSGFTAVLAPYFFIENSPSQYEFNRSNLTTNTLYTFDLSDNPAQNNVRSGVLYGPANIFTGTCAVPPANTVSVGVPVDNTVGTAVLDTNALAASLTTTLAPALDASLSASLPAAIAPLLWDEAVTNITTPNSIGERLKNCSTVATTGAQIASFNP